jgi:DNA modification methylase
MKIRDRIKELRRVKSSELIPNPKNWRTHPIAQQDALKGILAEVGFAGAVLARELDDGSLMLIDGHMRAETTSNQEIPVLVLDVTEAESDKLLATFDPIAALAESDAAALDSLLRNVDTGSEALQKMLADLAEDAGLYLDDKEVVEDEVPEPPVDPITKPGDLWLLGDHRLLCGDSTKAEDVERLMAGAKADMCFTSPPYNADTGAGDGDIFNRKPRKKLYGEEYGDNLDSSDYVAFARAALALCFEYTSGVIFWNVSYNANARHEYIEQIFPWLPYLVEQVCWKKHSAIPIKGSMRRAWEPVYIFSTDQSPLGLEEVESNFWDISNTGCQADGHKACFPVALPAKGMSIVPSAATVYDPFLGSGTTLIAAEQLGRKCYGMEISPQYCDVILKRWETLTGNKASLEKKNA